MLTFVAGSLVFIPCFFLARPQAGLIVPGVQSGVTRTAILVIVAVVGTTVAPWQLTTFLTRLSVTG